MVYLLIVVLLQAPNIPTHRLPPTPRPFTFIPNPKRAAVPCTAWVARSTLALFLTVVPFLAKGYRFALCCPPSTLRHAPVTHFARSEHRKTATSATSSG